MSNTKRILSKFLIVVFAFTAVLGDVSTIRANPIESEYNTEYDYLPDSKNEDDELGERSTTATEAMMATTATSSSADESTPNLDNSDLPFFFSKESKESINYGTGVLSYEDHIVTIPGRNGLDLNLTVDYSSDKASALEAYRYHDPPLFTNNTRARRKNNYRYPYQSIADGWRLKLPYVIPNNGTLIDYLVLADGTTYQYNKNIDTYHDWSIVVQTGHSKPYGYSRAGVVIRCSLTYLEDGRVEYYDDLGRLVAIVDRFGNKIEFFYSGFPVSGQYGTITIKDSNSNNIYIYYSDIKLQISLPDNLTVEYHMTGYDTNTKRNLLTHKIDQLGRKTEFKYFNGSALYDVYYRNPTSTASLPQSLLETIIYQSGAVTSYSYIKTQGWLTDLGWHEYYRLYSRQDKDGSAIYNQETFTFNGCFTGYPDMGKWLPARPPESYTATVTSANNGTKTVYTYNSKREPVKIETFVGSAKRHEEVLKYIGLGRPSWREQTYYNGNIQRKTTEQFTYYVANLLSSYWGTQAGLTAIYEDRGSRESPYLMSIDYGNDSRNHYGIPRTITYRQDANTVIKVENTLTTDGKAIFRTKTTVNNAEIERKDFTYDNFGNVKTKKEYINNSNFIQTDYTYTGGVFVSKEEIKENGTTLATTREYTYDTYGRPLTMKDGNGQVTKLEYDKIGRLTTKTNLSDNTFSKVEYFDGNASSLPTMIVTDENGRKIKTTYNRLGYPFTVEDVSEKGKEYLLAEYAYDKMSRVSTQWDAKRIKTDYKYDYLGRVTEKTIGPDNNNPRVYKEAYEYNDAFSSELSRVIKTVEGGTGSPAIKTATYTNSHGFIARTTRWIDATEVPIHYTYDYLGNMLEQREAAVAGLNGVERKTTYKYDGMGRLIKTTNPDNSTYQAAFDWLGRMISTTDANNQKSEYQYNALGLLKSESVPFEGTQYRSTTTYEYDKNGNLTLQKQTNGKPGTSTTSQTEYKYNDRNFLYRVNFYNGSVIANYVVYGYDKAGNVTSMKTANETQETKYEYDKQNRLQTLTDPMGKTETYTYDRNNNLETITDRNGNLTTNKYDELNRVKDVRVKLAKSTTNVPEFLAYGYASTGLLTREENENLTISYEYDNAGRLIKQTERPAGTSGQQDVVKSFEYDIHNNRTGFTLTQNSATRQNMSYKYNNMNRLFEVYDFGVKQATYEYYANGNRKSLTYPNGITTTYTYNHANLVTSLTNKKGTTTLSSYVYTYLLDGNQDSKKDHKQVQTVYTYDGLGRLTKEVETVPAGARGLGVERTVSRSYTFDKAGNRATMAVSTTEGAKNESYTMEYEYDKNNRLLFERNKPVAPSGATIVTAYSYDLNGNQLSKQIGNTSDIETRAYDVFNRLKGISPNSTNATYTYRPDGLRLSKSLDGQSTVHIWDGGNITLELDANGVLKSRFVRGMNLIKMVKPQDESYYLFNANGDVVQLASAAGDVVRNYYYDAFGNEAGDEILYGDVNVDGTVSAADAALILLYINGKNPDINLKAADVNADTVVNKLDADMILQYVAELPVVLGPATDSNPFRYSAEYYDDESGNYYLRARMYNPLTSRMTSPDPYWNVGNMIYGDNPNNRTPNNLAIRQSANLYVYCINNPIMYRDPSGYTIKADKDSFNYLQKLTDDKLQLNKNGTVTVLEKNSDPTRQDGTILVRKLIDHDRLCEIMIRDDTNFTYYEDDGFMKNGQPGKGSDAIVFLDPKMDLTGTAVEDLMGSNFFLVLGHELIHAQRGMNGLDLGYFDTNYVVDGKRYTAQHEELLVSGIWTQNENNHYRVRTSENSLRKENGLERRKYY